LRCALAGRPLGGRFQWAHVHVRAELRSRKIGAQTVNYLRSHLLDFVERREPTYGWVLSLAEGHVSAYAEHFADHSVLRLQDAQAVFFAALTLRDENREAFRKTLMGLAPA